MFPTEPIRRYINFSFAKKLDETAKAYGQEVAKIRLKMSPNSGMYFQAVVTAGVRLQRSNVEAWIVIVREACLEAKRPVDNEVRAYMLGEIHNMCEAGKKHIAQALALQITQSGMKLPDSLLPSLTAQANNHVATIESDTAREFKIEELREGLKQSVGPTNPAETHPPIPVPIVDETIHNTHRSKLTRGDRIALWIGVPGVLIAAVAIIVAVTAPEIRSWFKLDQKRDATQQTPKSISADQPQQSVKQQVQAGAKNPTINPSPTPTTIWADPATGLMWAGKDNGENVNWNDATNFCANLNSQKLGGYSSGWALPEIEQLKTLYDRSITKYYTYQGGINSGGFQDGGSYPIHVKQVELDSCCAWSKTMDGSSRAYYYRFHRDEGEALAYPIDQRGVVRALCVRNP